MNGESFYKPNAIPGAGTQHLQMPGGCPDCDAHQTVTAIAEGVAQITVHHDPTCPAYSEMRKS